MNWFSGTIRKWARSAALIAAAAALSPGTASAQGVSWSKRWGGTAAYDAGWGVGRDSSGNIYVGGYTASYGVAPGTRDALVLKYSSSGAVQSATTWGGSSNEYIYASATDSAGDTVLVGRSNSFTATYDALVVKITSAGTVAWAKTWGGPGSSSEYATGVAIDGSGNVYVSGMTDGVGGFGAGSYDVFVLKYNSSGTLQWQKLWGGTSIDWGFMTMSPDIAVDGSGNAYVTAGTFSYGSSPGVAEDVVILKYNASGVLQWSRTWGDSSNHEEGHSIVVDSAGKIYVAGVRNASTNNYSASGADQSFLLRLDSAGTVEWASQFATTTLDYISSISLDGSGNIYGTGRYLNDALLVKYTTSGTCQWGRSFGGSGPDVGYAGLASGLNFYVSMYDGSTNTATLATPTYTLTDLTSIATSSASGIETTPTGAESSPSGTVTSPTGAEAGSALVDVGLLNLQENGPPDTPVCISPADGSRDVSQTPLLQASAYNDTNGDPQTDSEFKICTDPLGTNTVYDVNAGIATSHQVGITLDPQTAYFWMCRYKDDHGNWSAWSAAALFKTGGTGPAGTYSIAGKVRRGVGVTVRLSGAATNTITAGVRGRFVFTGLLPGSYTVSPSAPPRKFKPGSRSVTITNRSIYRQFFK